MDGDWGLEGDWRRTGGGLEGELGVGRDWEVEGDWGGPGLGSGREDVLP